MDPAAKKTALRAIENGLYLVGCASGDTKNVFLASWLSQCSFEPPLVMMGLKKGTMSHGLITGTKGFVVNVPSSEQRALVQKFFKHADCVDGTIHGERFRVSDRFKAPVLEATPAWFEAEVVHRYDGGDHEVVVGRVIDAGVHGDGKFAPLTESATGWNYGG